MEYLNLSQDECCTATCCYKFNLEGCAAGVPYAQVSLIAADGTSTVRWINLDTGELVDVRPAGFVTGGCSEVPENDRVCYQFGEDVYSVFLVNGVRTVFLNDTLLTDPAVIDAALVTIAGATYENVINCGGDIVPAETCKGAHYEQLTLAAGVAQTITHDFAMTDPLAVGYSVRGVDGSTVGDWPTGVRFINHTATTVDVIADGIAGVVDVALFNTECLSTVVTSGQATTGGAGGDGTTEVADGVTIIGAGTLADPFEVANPVPDATAATDGQVLAVQADGSLAWEDPAAGFAPVVFKATNTNTSIPPSTSTGITTGWTNPINIGGGTFSGGAYTAPTAGVYRLTWYARFTTASWGANAEATAAIRVNGALVAAAAQVNVSAVTGETLSTGTAVTTVELAAGDIVQAGVYHEETTARALVPGAANNQFLIERIA